MARAFETEDVKVVGVQKTSDGAVIFRSNVSLRRFLFMGSIGRQSNRPAKLITWSGVLRALGVVVGDAVIVFQCVGSGCAGCSLTSLVKKLLWIGVAIEGRL